MQSVEAVRFSKTATRSCFDAASNNCSASHNKTPHSKVLQRSAGGFPGVWLHSLIFKRMGNIFFFGGGGGEEVKEKSGFLNKNTAASKKKKKKWYFFHYLFFAMTKMCVKKKHWKTKT